MPKLFIAQAEKELSAHSLLANRVDWINRTYITGDTDALAAEFGARGTQVLAKICEMIPAEQRGHREDESHQAVLAVNAAAAGVAMLAVEG